MQKKYVLHLAITAFLIFSLAGCASKNQMSMPSPFGGAQAFFHTLMPGETLWSLSKMYHVSLDDLVAVNSIANPNAVPAGRRLRIPAPGALLPQQPKTPAAARGHWTHIVIHHSATPEGNADIFDREHRARGFWNGLGYHFLVCNGSSGTRDGQIQVGDRWVKQIQGAHCNVGNMNEVGIGICLVGDFENGQRVSMRQFESLVELVESLKRQYRIPDQNIVRHKDVKHTTECPGRNFPWREFKSSLVPIPSISSPLLFADAGQTKDDDRKNPSWISALA